MGGSVVDKSKNTTCPKDMAIYMDALLEFNKQHPDQGTVLLDYLQNTVFNDRIPALLPPNTKVAHKIGSWPATGSYHDVGIVDHPSHPYIISLFSKDVPSSTHAYQVLQQLSLLIYDAQYSLTEMKLMVNGQALISDIPPILANDTVYLPLDTLADTLDVKVHKNIEENKIHLQGKHDVTIYPEQTKMLLDNELHHSHIPTEIIAGYLMVPLETITDIFDVSCTWESTRNTVYVSSEPVVEEAKEPNEPQEQPSAPPSYSEQLLAPLFLVFILGCLVLVVKK